MAAATKMFSGLCRVLQALASIFCVGTMSYFIVRISQKNGTPSWETYVVEAICGASFLYSCLILLCTCCCHRKSGFFTLTIPIDAIFAAAFVVSTVLLRGNSRARCSALNAGTEINWLQTYEADAQRTCKLVRGIFILSIVQIFLYLLTLVIAFVARKQVKRDHAFGPSPSNNYTSGFRRKKSNRKSEPAVIAPTHNHNHNHITKPAAAATAGTGAAALVAPGTASSTGKDIDQEKGLAVPGREYHTTSPAPDRLSAGYPPYQAGHNHNNFVYASPNAPNDLPAHPGPQDGTYYRAYNPRHQPSVSELSAPGTAISGPTTVSYPDAPYSELDSTAPYGQQPHGMHGAAAPYPSVSPNPEQQQPPVAQQNPNFFSAAPAAELDSGNRYSGGAGAGSSPVELPDRGYGSNHDSAGQGTFAVNETGRGNAIDNLPEAPGSEVRRHY